MKVSKTYKVIISQKERMAYRQDRSMARTYMNRFAINEDDQFEIHVKDCKDLNKAAEEVILKARQGSGYHRF